jgi:hypothetical protein
VLNIVTVTVPAPDDSAFVMGGTSFAGSSVAVNVFVVVVGAVGDEELFEQPAANRLRATATNDKRFIVNSP